MESSALTIASATSTTQKERKKNNSERSAMWMCCIFMCVHLLYSTNVRLCCRVWLQGCNGQRTQENNTVWLEKSLLSFYQSSRHDQKNKQTRNFHSLQKENIPVLHQRVGWWALFQLFFFFGEEILYWFFFFLWPLTGFLAWKPKLLR